MELKDAPALLQQVRSLTARLARHVGRDHAEDLASEALVRSLRRPAPDGHQGPWIERICRNLRIDHLRRQARAVAFLTRAPEPTPVATPEDEALDRERREALLAAIPSMPADLQHALVARFVDGRGYDDVAVAEGISPATARTRVFRALDRLRKTLVEVRCIFCSPTGFGLKGLGTALVAPALTVMALLPAPMQSIDARRIPTLLAQGATASSRGQRVPRPPERSPVVVPVRPAPTNSVPPGNNPAPQKSTPTETVARRDPPRADSTMKTPPAVQRFDYVDDKIDGENDKPNIDWVWGDAPKDVHSSLIEIPRSFASALAKTLEDL
jgi:RNA polymerase sigma-70 factor, ECF subfamily